MTLSNDPSAGGGTENYYDTLGLKPGASDDEIEAAYSDLSAMFAPAGVPTARLDYARRQRARLAAAYAVLADPERRAAYDSARGNSTATPTTPSLVATVSAPPSEPPSAPSEASPAPPAADDFYQAALRTVRGETKPEVSVDAASPLVDEPPVIVPPEPVAAQVFTPAPSRSERVVAPAIAPALAETEPLVAQTAAFMPDVDSATVADTERISETGTPAPSATVADTEWISETGLPDDGELLGASDVLAAAEDDIPPWELTPPDETNELDEADEADEDDDEVELPPTRRPTGAPVSTAARSGVARTRVEPVRPAAPPRPPAPRGSVTLPNRREAAQIVARQASASPPPPPVSTRGTALRAAAGPRPATRPQSRPQPAYEDDELADMRGTRPARTAAPVRRKRRRADTNRLIYQILTLTIGLVLVISTVASVYGTIANTSTAGVIATVPPTSNVTSLVNNAASFEQQKQYQFAEQFYLQALQTDPQNLTAMVGLARVYRDEQPANPAKAQQYAQQAVQLGGTSQQATEAAGILAQLAAPAGSPAATSAATTPAAAGTVPAAATPAP